MKSTKISTLVLIFLILPFMLVSTTSRIHSKSIDFNDKIEEVPDDDHIKQRIMNEEKNLKKSDADILWSSYGVKICSIIGTQEPRMCSDGNGGAIIAWQDRRSDFYENRRTRY